MAIEPTIFILGVNTHMATMQPQTNMNTGQQMTMTGMQATDTKHGGHELMDVHEVLKLYGFYTRSVFAFRATG